MKQHLLLALLTLGITLVYYTDYNSGMVYTNVASSDATFIIDKKRNNCKIFASDGYKEDFTAQYCTDLLKGVHLSGEGMLAIITPFKESSKLESK